MKATVRLRAGRAGVSLAPVRHLAGGLLAAGLLLLAACGGDDDGGASERSSAPPAPETGPGGAITVPLVEENDSGASGMATLSSGGDSASVTIELNSDDGRYHAHVHDVSCERYRRMNDFSAQLATLTEGLNDVGGGRSASDLSEPLSSYTRAGFSINVHEFDSPYPVVACGDLSAP
jgi:hypothetical protein